jgi:hypothetical protein
MPEGESLCKLAAQFQKEGRRGQIIGPHGTGKTTLLESLIPQLEALGEKIVLVTLGERRRRWLSLSSICDASTTLLVLDGGEQLSFLFRRWLAACCRRRGIGLLMTGHADLGLPTLWKTAMGASLACQVVEKLAAKSPFFVTKAEVAQALSATNGNLREALFRLYDVYEFRRRQATG